MEWRDQAIVLTVKNHGETAARMQGLSKGQGWLGGRGRGGAAVEGECDPHLAQQVRQRRDVDDVGQVGKRQRLIGEQARREQGRRVLSR